jgi:hypothetical protein
MATFDVAEQRVRRTRCIWFCAGLRTSPARRGGSGSGSSSHSERDQRIQAAAATVATERRKAAYTSGRHQWRSASIRDSASARDIAPR